MHIAAFYLNDTYLLCLKNIKRAVFGDKPRLISHLVLSFKYLRVSNGSLDGAMVRHLDVSTGVPTDEVKATAVNYYLSESESLIPNASLFPLSQPGECFLEGT